MYQPIGNKDILKTKIPRSGKYDDVGPTLNTGGNVLKKAPPEPVKLGHEELFKRMKGRTLHRLLTEPNPEVKVVLLDVRPPEAYEQCHIMEASNYPHTMLSRSTNEYTPAVFQNKNKEGVLLVCYDEDESIAINTCNTMFKKGIDNIMMLTGGLKKYAWEGNSNIFGTPPPPSPTSSVVSNRSRRSGSRSCRSSSRGSMGSAGSRLSSHSGVKPYR
jgi:centrosomal protein CEP41